MTTQVPVEVEGRRLFAAYAFPPNELGYCGPPDSSVLLNGHGPAAIDRHAKGFDGAWPYLDEIAAATGACGSPRLRRWSGRTGSAVRCSTKSTAPGCWTGCATPCAASPPGCSTN